MNYAAEWDAEHAKRQMYDDKPLAPVLDWFERWDAKHPDIDPPRVLDIGCGQGTNSIWLGRMGFKVCGFDSSPAAVERLLKRCCYDRKNHHFQYFPRVIIADITKPWPYQSATFDAAFEVRVLENLDAGAAKFAYKQIARALKPGGLFFCLTASQDRGDKYTTCGTVRTTTDLKLAEWLSAACLEIAHISREYEGTLEDWNVQAVRQ